MLLFLICILKNLKIINIFITGVLGTLWYWNFITIEIISVFYIFKIKKLNFWDFLTGIILSACCCTENFNPVITPVIFFSFLSGTCIFRKYNQKFKFSTNLKNILKNIIFGILIAIIPGIINFTEFLVKNYNLEINLYNIWPAFLRALNPSISEEIVFRFFMLAVVTDIFKNKIPKTKIANLLIYILLILPHVLMHDEFAQEYWISNIFSMILYLIYNCLVFGIPSVWLIKNKNLWSAISFHWFCDFVRFIFFKNY